MANEIATIREKAAVIHQEFDRRAAEFAALLPADVGFEEFKRVSLQALALNPKLVECTKPSLFRAFTDAARHGWVPDGRDCYIDLRENYKTKELTATCIPGKHGYLKNFIGKTLRDWRAHVVRKGDDYEVELGDNEHFRHRVDPFTASSDDNDIIGAYSVAIGMDGRIVSREFMSLPQLLKARAKSASWSNERARQYSPWTTHFEEMCEKTVMKRHADRLQKSKEAAKVLQIDMDAERGELTAIETAPTAAPAQAKRGPGRPKGSTKPAEQLKQIEAQMDIEEAIEDRSQAARHEDNSGHKPNGSAEHQEPEPERAKSPSPPRQSAQPAGRNQPCPEDVRKPKEPEPDREHYDPLDSAREAGEAAYELGTERTGYPREYLKGNRYDELDAWYEGWDAAASDSASAGQAMV